LGEVKKRYIFIIAALIAVLGYVAYIWWSPTDKIRGIYLVPEDAVFILESDEPLSDWNDFRESKFWGEISELPAFQDLKTEAEYLDTLIKVNSWLKNIVRKNHFLMSVHMTTLDDYDYLFAIDIGKVSKISGIESSVVKTAELSGFKVTNRNHEGTKILELLDPKTRERMFMSFQKNYLVLSFNNRILERSIEEMKLPVLGRNERFMDVSDRTSFDGICRLYVQYQHLPEFLGVFSNDWKSDPYNFKAGPLFSALNADTDENELRIEGYTNLHPEATYIKALLNSGKASLELYKNLPNRTAYFINFGFSDIDKFYGQLTQQLENDAENAKAFKEYTSKTEKLLNISIKEDVFGWIDDEIILAQIKPANVFQSESDLMVLAKARDHETAVKKLDKVSEQIKKRTPAKFKSFQYKQHTINYLAIKGLFSMFFGNAFEGITQPYYTIVDEVVIFSNDPKTIVGYLEDYENNRLLINNPATEEFVDAFETKSTLFAMALSESTYPMLQKVLKGSSRAELVKNKAAFGFIDYGGFQWTERNENTASSDIRLSFGHRQKDTTYQLSKDSIDRLYDHFFSNLSDQTILASETREAIKQFIDDGWYKRYFRSDSTQIEIKAETRNGLFHGDYYEFYLNGEKKVKGKYRKGRRNGRWVYYSETGDVEKKVRY
jgi:hypothetical protein